MITHISNGKDFFPDDGRWEKLYPIPTPNHERELLFDNKVQRTGNIQANIVALFEEWILSFFEPDYFRFKRIKTQSSFSEFKSFMKDIYKKDKPILIIDVNTTEHVEDFLFGLNMINRYNMVDPRYDATSSKLIYSIGVLETDAAAIRFRRNRYRFNFEILIMENTAIRRDNTFTHMLMNIRHRSKFTLPRTIMSLLPLEYIHNIAKTVNMDYKSDEFLSYLNQHSNYPIIHRTLPNGQWMFYIQQPVNLYVDVPDIPQKDSAEISEAFEMGAQIRDSFVIEADLPSEFIYMTPLDRATEYIAGKDPDPENIYYISPYMAFPEFNETYFSYKLVNKLTVVIDNPKENTLNVVEDILKTVDTSLYETLVRYLSQKQDLSELIHVEIYENEYRKDVHPISFQSDKDGNITIPDPDFRSVYMILTYVDFEKVNMVLRGEQAKYIGTIEKY